MPVGQSLEMSTRLKWSAIAWYMIGADLAIKGGGQEPYLAKAELHTGVRERLE